MAKLKWLESRTDTRMPPWICTLNGIVCKVISIWIWQNVIYTSITAAAAITTTPTNHTHENRMCPSIFVNANLCFSSISITPSCVMFCECIIFFWCCGSTRATHCPEALYMYLASISMEMECSANGHSNSSAFRLPISHIHSFPVSSHSDRSSLNQINSVFVYSRARAV